MKQRNNFSMEALEKKLGELPARLNGRWEKLRFERALSWLKRGENEDHDVQFILLWVALDALFGLEKDILPPEPGSAPGESVRSGIPDAVAAMLDEDTEGIIWRGCYDKRKTVARILKNPYIYNPFWRMIAENGIHSPDARRRADHPKVEESRRWFAAENRRALSFLKRNSAAARRDFVRIVLKRLGTLRNQLMHGASAHSEGLNRSQVEDGLRLLSALVPRILHLMMESPDKLRGVVAYPPFGEKDALFDKKFDEEAFERYFKRTMRR